MSTQRWGISGNTLYLDWTPVGDETLEYTAVTRFEPHENFNEEIFGGDSATQMTCGEALGKRLDVYLCELMMNRAVKADDVTKWESKLAFYQGKSLAQDSTAKSNSNLQTSGVNPRITKRWP